MSEQETWVERRQRAVKCKIHGLHYDPKMHAACPLCRKGRIQKPVRKRPQLFFMLLALLGVTIILYRMFGPGSPELAYVPTLQIREETLIADPQGIGQLDPEAYRSAFEAFERALFEPTAANLDTIGEQIRVAGKNLSSALREGRADGAPHPLVLDLEGLTAAINAEGFNTAKLESARQRWLATRQRYVRAATWLRGRLPTTDDRADFAVYQDVVSTLVGEFEGAAGQVRAHAEALREISPLTAENPDLERQQILQQWRDFALGWQRRVAELRRQLPSRPSADASTTMLLAVQHLERAFQASEALARDFNLPMASFEPRLDAARRTMDEARLAVDDLFSE